MDSEKTNENRKDHDSPYYFLSLLSELTSDEKKQLLNMWKEKKNK